VGVVSYGIVGLVVATVAHVGRRLLFDRSSRQCVIPHQRWNFVRYRFIVVYYESINRELKIRCKVNRREVCEYDGWVCDLEVIVDPSRLTSIPKDTVLAKIDETRYLRFEEEEWSHIWLCWLNSCSSKKRSGSRWVCNNKILINSFINYLSTSFRVDVRFH
jgi:hypothetical protein